MTKLTSRVFLDVYFDLNGRIGRGDFWAYGVALNITLFAATLGLAMIPSPWAVILTLLVSLVAIWGYTGLMLKRGHDRGRPALLSIGLVAARVVVFLMTSVQGYTPALIVVQGALIIYVLIDYALLPGMKGDNRYGPSPGGANFNKTPLNLDAGPGPDEPALSTPNSNA